MKPIFISYRRDDGPDTAQLLQMHFISMFGEDAVFLDTTMKAGQEFTEELRTAVINSKIVIVMIGKNWKGIDPQINRLNQESDWVRKELEIALADEKKKIFPLLVKGATTKDSFDGLPTSIQKISEFNVAELREKEFKQDLLPLIPLIEPCLELSDPLKDLPLDTKKYKFPKGGPFKGLKYFTEEDAKLFFGRGTEIRKLYNKIKDGGVLFLYGQSGSGKSSLLFAGLKPRLEFKGWEIVYFRREKGINLAEKLNEFVEQLNGKAEKLVILDQIEEIFTNPDATISSETEAQQLLSSVQNATDKISLILSFRKEYLAEIKKLFTGLDVDEMYLETLQTKGLLEAITGINKSSEAKDKYELEFVDKDEKLPLPIAIAQSVIGDEESNAAPLLQILLSKMWGKVKDDHPRKFTKELLESVKSQNMASLIKDQVANMEEKYKTEVYNGLVLDVLYYFTTPRGTSDAHSKDEIHNNYDYPKINEVIEELKNKYLLTEIIQKDAEPKIRLAHDSLAPLIRELFGQSTLAGQKAARLLDSKQSDIELGNAVEFSKPDLAIIDAGKNGMRKWTEKEQLVIENSRKLIQRHDLALEEINKKLILKVKEAQEQNQKAQSLTLATVANEQLDKNPTFAIRLAEMAWQKSPAYPPTPSIQTIVAKGYYRNPEHNMLFFEKNLEHTSLIHSATFSPDGSKIVTASLDNIAKLWDAVSGKMIADLIGHGGFVNSAAFSPNGSKIVTASNDNTAIVWDAVSRKRIADLIGHTSFVKCAVFSPDGTQIVTASHDKTAKLWEAASGKMIADLKGHIFWVNNAVFSPDGTQIVTASHDKTARLWEATSGKMIADLIGHKGSVTSAAFSPDGTRIVTASSEETAKLWEAASGKMIADLIGHTFLVNSAAFSPDGSKIVTASWDNTAKIWDSVSGEMIADLIGHTTDVKSAAFSPDGSKIVTASDDRTAKIWDAVSGKMIADLIGHDDCVTRAAFSPNGTKILTASDDTTAKIWGAELGKKVTDLIGHTTDVKSAAFSSDASKIVTASGDRTAKIWDAASGKNIADLIGHDGWLASAFFSPDGSSIVTASGDTTAKIWGAASGNVIANLIGHYDSVTRATFSPNGTKIVTSSDDKTAKIWDAASGKSIADLIGHTSNVKSAAFSPDGSKIVTASLDNTAKIWDAVSGKKIADLIGHQGFVISAAFSPDGTKIVTASSDKTAKIWDAASGKRIADLIGHDGFVISAAFSSADGNKIVTASWDNTGKVWDAASGKMIADLIGHENFVNSADFSPDGNKIVTASLDNTAKIWLTPEGIMVWLATQNIYKLTQKDLKKLGIDFIEFEK